MLADFFGFILSCLQMVVRLFQNTLIDGISYEIHVVGACMLSVVLTSLVVKFRPSFRPPKPPRNSSSRDM